MTQQFSGHIYIFNNFDVGDDIDLNLVKSKQLVRPRPMQSMRYFKEYHTPLPVELPHPHKTSHCEIVKLYQFGVITLRYKIPFHSTLENLHKEISDIDNTYREQSFEDAAIVFKHIKSAIRKPSFFHLSNSYLLIQVDVEPGITGKALRDEQGDTIASLLRFEKEMLSEYSRDEILEQAFGYYRGDLIIIDTGAAFVYDEEYEELLDLFEFINVQHLELQYFDRVLDSQLNIAYNREAQPLPIKAYLPMWGTLNINRTGELGNLKVEISVITERLENNIRLTGEPYYSEVYEELTKTLDLQVWKDSIAQKLAIIEDISEMFESKINTIRQDMINILIVILIFLELMIALVNYLS